MINRSIFEGSQLRVSGDPEMVKQIYEKYHTKMRRLFGIFYKHHINHKPNDSKVNEALLRDAIQSGKQRELPKELQKEYHRMAGT